MVYNIANYVLLYLLYYVCYLKQNYFKCVFLTVVQKKKCLLYENLFKDQYFVAVQHFARAVF